MGPPLLCIVWPRCLSCNPCPLSPHGSLAAGRLHLHALCLPHSTLPPPLCREWVASEDGEALATQLISVLVAEHLSASGEEQPAG